MTGALQRRRSNPATGQQRGVVLVVALLLLLVLTILGAAGLVSAMLELRLAGNVDHQARAFAAAEHAIEQAVLTADLATTSSLAAPVKPSCRAACATPTTGDPFDYSLYYDASASDTLAPDGGHSLGAGLQANHFIIEATGESGPGARSDHTQGFYVLGPAEH